MTKLEENKIGFLIFAFVFEIRPILCPHTSLWGVLATPNQHLLTLPSSSAGKSSDLHAGVQQFKSRSGHKFFFFAYILHTHAYTCTHMDTHAHARKHTHFSHTYTHTHVRAVFFHTQHTHIHTSHSGHYFIQHTLQSYRGVHRHIYTYTLG